MRALRSVAGATLGTALLGAFLGYAVAAVLGAFVFERGVVGSGESPEARAFMIGYLSSDPDSLAALTQARDLVSQAAQFQSTQGGRGQWVPISLTYLGGGSQGRFHLDIYAVEMRTSNSRSAFFPLTLTLRDGKVIRRE